jgi:hypothetical protein
MLGFENYIGVNSAIIRTVTTSFTALEALIRAQAQKVNVPAVADFLSQTNISLENTIFAPESS